MSKVWEGQLSAAGLRFAIVVSRFNSFITERLLGGAMDALTRTGANPDQIDVIKVPGSWVVPLVAGEAARSKRYDAVICLSAVIRGETPHFDYVAAEAARPAAMTTRRGPLLPSRFGSRIPPDISIRCQVNIMSMLRRAINIVGNWLAAVQAGITPFLNKEIGDPKRRGTPVRTSKCPGSPHRKVQRFSALPHHLSTVATTPGRRPRIVAALQTPEGEMAKLQGHSRRQMWRSRPVK